jgi:hypothetical protein
MNNLESHNIKKITVVIPTYWTWPASDSRRQETGSFDHPTPLDGESTLPRLLDDLCEQHFKDFSVLVLTGLSHPDLRQVAAIRMAELLEPYRSRLNLFTCDGPVWTRLQTALEAAGMPTTGFNLGSYSGIRNLQLLIPHLWGAQIIVALDDDERVEPNYVDRALLYIGKPVNTRPVLGLAGPYLQPDGSVYLNVNDLTGNVFLDKGHYINKAFRTLIDDKETLVPSPLTLGGNMVFHHDCFTRVPFDPGITRGEDIDYLINARLQGIDWWFDASLTILHLPPKHYDTPPYQRMREDVFRFIYEREKLQLHGFTEPAWLEPYPGALLRQNLIQHAHAALQSEMTADLASRFGEPAEIIEQATTRTAHHLSNYKPFVQTWNELMLRIEQDKPLQRNLLNVLKN